MKGKIDGLMGKLPDLGELAAMITGGAKDPDIVNAKDGSTETTNMENLLAMNSDSEGSGENVTPTGNDENIVPLDVNGVSKKADSVSESASYEETGGETIVIKSGSEQDTIEGEDTTGGLIPIIVGGGGGGDSEVGDLLYKGG